MARLPLPDTKQNPEFAAVLKELEQSRGVVSNALRSMGHAPEALRRFAAVGDYARFHSTLSARTREIVIVITGRASTYAINHHGPLALQAGVTQAELDALCQGTVPPTFNDTDQAVTRYVLEFTSAESVTDGTFAALQKVMTPQELTDISFTSAYYVAFAMMTAALGAHYDSQDFVAAELEWQQQKDQA
ncbi:carboxymuconolactone decarboxylase family protein [Bordetella sp. BOR01]|uniref:carboxymuconolactone decarboxylase family protein n=1 Tax=Bordetella sp. BOR01 TaxID=2854779 RepID=UPI001C488A09|nr:carboxymuconolactone decarboxylase family protein [Bordetella sp. BOR01]MBV7484827.1 carboxymuconolactone decarboxylase family protein [Bordetella sp. BOR01]